MKPAPGAIIDAAERERALDPAGSAIVQAPAGSGKTGLLIQRYLKLLASVERPEEILAITFTRKAAAEMRARVLLALARARDDTPPEPPNKRLTWELARAALSRDRERNWRVLENAARLRIQTIDSLCSSLARQLPVVSRLGATPAVVENAAHLHREAADRTLARIEGHDALAAHAGRLLTHLDGDWSAARDLLERMLARRDQWIRPIARFRADGQARGELEHAFRAERVRALAHARALMPAHEVAAVASLAAFSAGCLAESGVASPVAPLGAIAEFPPATEECAAGWLTLAGWMLTKSGAQFRKRVDKNLGFPTGKGAAEDAKRQMIELLGRLGQVEGLAEALEALRAMPPANFTDAQWEVLGAVVALLKHAPAELALVFAERGEIDFPGIAQGAVAALGEEDAPTDLLLALDARLMHLLVDEFQDTSLGQWDLVTRLTSGWTPGDGRSVFLVGDPMQSIYRFREADVALFLRARRAGLPSVKLADVRLATNFRSQRGIVEWVNRAFAGIFPQAEDPDAGAVPYAPSAPHHAEAPGPAVQWHPFIGGDKDLAREREAKRVAELVRAALDAPGEGTVAVLVRNRSHLERIVPALKAGGIPFRAVDIEPLGGRPVIQDLLALTRALSHPADRVAWLALLRAPWCALTLHDLHALTGGVLAGEGARATVWELLEDAERLGALGAKGRGDALRLRAVLAPFVAHRLRGSLRERVERAWLALGGPACVERAADLEDAETFFDQLDAIEDAGDLEDPAVLEEHLGVLHASPDMTAGSRVQLMTIHKAKGLEFGTVIVPGLDRLPRAADRPLFAWKARADRTLLMAPMRAAGEKAEPAYDYLRALDDAAGENEVERLFYVAATRAIERLHLLGFARMERKADVIGLRAPSPRSLLGKAWHEARDSFEAALGTARDDEVAADEVGPAGALRRLDPAVLALDVPEPPGARVAPGTEAPRIEFSWVGETARHVGTITHRWLQRIATDGLASWDAGRVAGLAAANTKALARLGVPPGERETAAARVALALTRALADKRGRWLLGSHQESHCEYRLRVAGPEGIRGMVIDRLFTEADGTRWIVDYKTSTHEGADPEGFLDRERDRYAEQLGGYGSALEARGAHRLGLYFPLLEGWREI